MKNSTLALLFLLIISACSSVKTTQKAINSGNYDKAISLAVENLRKSKTKKGNQPYIPMLEEAFKKATQRDLSRIDFLKKDGNPSSIEDIYNSYLKINEWQEIIKPLLPLRNSRNGIEAQFEFKNYTSEIIDSKNKLTIQLYNNTITLFKSASKLDYRRIYDDLVYIENLSPNYKDTRSLIEKAYSKGTDYVLVSMKNSTKQIIPKRLAKDLLDFDTYGFDDKWTVYHSTPNNTINYDFGLDLILKEIRISPERIKEKEFVKKREIIDGWEYQVDKNGKEVVDAKGNKIKVDKLIKVRCVLNQITQLKTTEVFGQVRYVNFNTQQLLKSFPVKSGYFFEHVYANYKGDERALTGDFKDLIKVKAIQFPTNEQMVFDAGNDLKRNLKQMILRNKFRK
ncbi:MAG: hypothetical protein ACI8WA_000627 [Polaribacter sp.]|jgi:hypothetical protein